MAPACEWPQAHQQIWTVSSAPPRVVNIDNLAKPALSKPQMRCPSVAEDGVIILQAHCAQREIESLLDSSGVQAAQDESVHTAHAMPGLRP